MKKIFAILLAVSAYAVTPKWEYKPVKQPQIKVTIKIPDKVFTDWFKEHSIRFTAPVLN